MAAIGRERVEVVPGVGHLGALVDLEAHAEEDVLDLALHLGQEVQPPAPERLAGQRDVEGALRVEPLELLALDRLAARLDGGLEPRADPVQEHAALAVAHAAQRLREVALPAEVADARVVELAGVGGGGDRLLARRFGTAPSPRWLILPVLVHGPGPRRQTPRLVGRIGRALAPVPGEPGRGKQEGAARRGHGCTIA